jgi:hypothetical protein
VIERGLLAASEWPSLRSSWAQRLKSGVDRLLVYIIARAVDIGRLAAMNLS